MKLSWTTPAVLSISTLFTVSLAGCCKDKAEETPDVAPVVPVVSVAEVPKEEPAAEEQTWKTKCPDAERKESGTVKALVLLNVLEKPESDAKKLTTLSTGTWVNLLGSKGTWYCIDYPCGEAKLCPGWVVSRQTEKKEPVDAGVKDAGSKDAGKTDAGKTDAGKTDAGKTDGGKAKPQFKLPKILLQKNK